MSDKFDFEAFDEGRVDQLLRQTMAGHRIEPKPGLWKGISRKLLWKELIHLNFSNVSRKLWLAGAGALFLVSVTLYLGLENSEPGIVPARPGTNVTRSTGFVNPVSAPASNTIVGRSQAAKSGTVNMNRPVIASGSENRVVTGIASNQKHMAFMPGDVTDPAGEVPAREVNAGEAPDVSDLFSTTAAEPVAISGISRLLPLRAILPGVPAKDTIITVSNQAGIMKFRKGGTDRPSFFSASLGVTPEIAFYSDPEAYTRANFWLNGVMTYHISRFSIASGFGLGYIYDEGNYRVEYKSRDSVGYFTSVTSYSVGSNNEITYNTQTVTVYDSLLHSNDFRTKNRYSYLQVPLLLGYRFYESSRISLTFQAGPALSVLLGTRKADPVIEYRNARIIRVDDDTPTRKQTNWQIWANLYCEMRLTKQISIFLEPGFKYYMNPMVTQENMTFRSPWALGLGIGLQFNLGQETARP